jgi:ribosome-associated protein
VSAEGPPGNDEHRFAQMSSRTPADIPVRGPIALGAFVKLCGAALTGGEAKVLVQSGLVRVNGEIEMRRGHAVRPGDVVEVESARFRVTGA